MKKSVLTAIIIAIPIGLMFAQVPENVNQTESSEVSDTRGNNSDWLKHKMLSNNSDVLKNNSNNVTKSFNQQKKHHHNQAHNHNKAQRKVRNQLKKNRRDYNRRNMLTKKDTVFVNDNEGVIVSSKNRNRVSIKQNGSYKSVITINGETVILENNNDVKANKSTVIINGKGNKVKIIQ